MSSDLSAGSCVGEDPKLWTDPEHNPHNINRMLAKACFACPVREACGEFMNTEPADSDHSASTYIDQSTIHGGNWFRWATGKYNRTANREGVTMQLALLGTVA